MTAQELVREDIKEIVSSIQKEAPKFEGQTILISGGAGFLGNYIVATFLELNKQFSAKGGSQPEADGPRAHASGGKKPCKIIVMDNFITGSKTSVIADAEKNPNFQFIEHDVRKPIPLNINADYLIHAAGLASPYYYRKFPLETIEVAVNGTKNFLEYAKQKKIKSMLYFSSSEIYGDPNPNAIPTPETYWGNVSATGPRACYDESKRLGETLCATYHQLYNVPVKVVRPFNVYGPGMKVNDYRVIPTFMVKAARGEILPVHDKGNQTRTFCYITDAIQGFLKVLASEKNGETYNVGTDKEEINMVSLANLISQLSPKPAPVQLINYPESYPAGEPQRRCPNISKIQNDLNYQPRIDLKTGLARTFLAYRHILESENRDDKTTLA